MTCNLSIFIVNNFYCVMNCLNINRVRFYKTKFIDIVTLKVLPTSCSRYNSEEKSIKFPNPKMKLQKTYEFPCASSIIRYLEHIEKMTSFLKYCRIFISKFYTFISILHKMFLLSHCLIVWWKLQMNGRLLANTSDKETGMVFALILHTFSISKIFQILLVIKNH